MANRDLPAVMVFCCSCVHWTEAPAYDPEHRRRRPLYQSAPFGLCTLTGEFFFETHLCGSYRDQIPIRTFRRLNEHPREPIQLAMGHHMGPETTCANHPLGQSLRVCGVAWAEHQARPSECPYPRPEWSGGHYERKPKPGPCADSTAEVDQELQVTPQ